MWGEHLPQQTKPLSAREKGFLSQMGGIQQLEACHVPLGGLRSCPWAWAGGGIRSAPDPSCPLHLPFVFRLMAQSSPSWLVVALVHCKGFYSWRKAGPGSCSPDATQGWRGEAHSVTWQKRDGPPVGLGGGQLEGSIPSACPGSLQKSSGAAS